MSRPRLQLACRIYLTIVIATAFYSLAAVVGCNLPHAVLRGHELVLERAENIVVWSTLLSFILGSVMFIGCFCVKFEPPDLLAWCWLMALVLLVMTLFFLPAIQTA
jgi:hypothetical protein